MIPACSPVWARKGRERAHWPSSGELSLWGALVWTGCPLPGLSASSLDSGLGVHLPGDPLPQLRPLVLLSLADFLGAAVLIPTMAIHLLPTQRFGAAHSFCPYGRMFGMMFYAISLLMVLVYAGEVNRVVGGWRATQENGSCCPKFQRALPYALACCLILVHVSQNSCSKARRRPGPPLAPQHPGTESSITFLVFVALVVSACVVLYCRVKRWQCQDRHGLRSEALAGRSQVTRSFQLALVLCWMPACLLVVLSFTGLQLSTLFPLLVATALTAPLQGFLNSLVYGWLRGNFRQEVAGERLRLHCSPDLKAFYDDSLAASG
ncbi:uncharacterized protein M6D78_010917 isoform 3-T3 [Vipera latastei]